MELVEFIVGFAALSALIAGLTWLDRRYDLGLMDDEYWGMTMSGEIRRADHNDGLRERIEQLEAAVADPDQRLAREIDALA